MAAARGATVRDLMQADVKTVRPDTPLVELERLLVEARISGAPVVDRDGNLVGVVSRSDLVRELLIEESLHGWAVDYYNDLGGYDPDNRPPALAERLTGRRVADVMVHTLVSVAPDASVRELARTLRERGVHRALVTDAEGRLLGIATSMDVVAWVAEGA